jgi:hypothetical protein
MKVGVALALLAGPLSLVSRAQEKPGAPSGNPAAPSAVPAAPAGGLGGARGGGAQPSAPASMPGAGRAPEAGRGPDAGRGSEAGRGAGAGERSNVRISAPEGDRGGAMRGPDEDRGFAHSRGDRGPGAFRGSRESSPSVRVRIGGGDRGYYDAPRRHYRYGVRTYPRYVGTRCVVRKRLVRTGHGPRLVVRRVCFR